MYAFSSIQRQESHTFTITGLPWSKCTMFSPVRAKTIQGGKGHGTRLVGQILRVVYVPDPDRNASS